MGMALGMLAVISETELEIVRAMAGIRRLTFKKVSTDMPKPAHVWVREVARRFHLKTPQQNDLYPLSVPP